MGTPDTLIGTTLGACQILDILGRGGMGVIYKARQLSLDRVVALKVLSPALANDVNFVARFQREARAIARVNHSNILAVYDVGNEKDTWYMIMELVEGESLAELQQRQGGGPLKFEDACRYVREAALGLEAAHAAGLTHRDVKPENLMLTRKGIIKVSDFGLAKESDATTTSADAVMGTPAFMSPEQCDGKKVTFRSDIYSLGGSFYKLVTGRLPFEAETAMSMMYHHKHEAVIPPRDLIPGLPKGISDAIVRMMAKKPEDRFGGMAEVIAAIDQVVPAGGGEAAGARSLGPEDLRIVLPPAPPPPPRRGGAEGALSGEGFGAAVPPSLATDRVRASVRGASERLGPREAAAARPPSARSSAHLSPPSFISATENGFTLARQGDELAARGDRLGALRVYRQALQAGGLDGATQERLEKELLSEIAARRQAGEGLLQRSLLVEAGREFRIMMELDPADEGTKATLKQIEAKLAGKRALINDIRTAIGAAQFEQAIALWDSAPPDLREEGLGKQVEHLRAVVAPSVKLCEQGETYNTQGRLEEALANFQDALRIDENCERARQGLNDVQSKLHRIDTMMKEGYEIYLSQDYARAVESWRPILHLRPGHSQAVKSIVDACLALAQECRAEGDLKGTLKAYAMAREVDPQNRTVARSHDELTELSEKEQALTERATDAAAHRRMGEAIRYWQEVRRINPGNRVARQSIVALSETRRWRMLRVGGILLVVTGGLFTAYHYLIESLTLRGINRLLQSEDADDETLLQGYEAALDKLERSYFIFTSDREIKELKRRAQYKKYQVEANQLLQAKQYGKAVDVLQKAKALLDAPEQVVFDLYIQEALCRDHEAKGEVAMREQQWDEAQLEFQKLRATALDPLSQGQLSKYVATADRALEFARNVQTALRLLKENRTAEAIRLLKRADDSGFNDAFIQQKLEALGYRPEDYQKRLQEAIRALNEPWRPAAAATALEALDRARAADPTAPRLEALARYATDMKQCAELGMVLVNTKKPEDQALVWGLPDEREAFCVDRYEYPNQAGVAPQANVPWLEAKGHCERQGKQLCTWRQWQAACRAKEASIWTFGSELIPEACNWDSGAVAKSGAYPKCHNQVGAFDMNGNLAEWTLDGEEGKANEAYQAGGHFGSGAQAARCVDLDRLSEPKDQSSGQVGFRCCRPLEHE